MLKLLRTRGRGLGILLLWLQLLASVAVAAPGRGLARGLVRASEKVESMAGGWALATPMIVAGTNLIQEALGGEDYQNQTVGTKDLLMGMGTDMALVGLTKLAVRTLPLPPLAKAALITTAGFMGWEIGTGNLSKTDWALLGAEIATATALQVGLPILAAAAGIALGPIALTALTIGGTLAVGAFFDHLRKKAKERQGSGSGKGGGDPGTTQAGDSSGTRSTTSEDSGWPEDSGYETSGDSTGSGWDRGGPADPGGYSDNSPAPQPGTPNFDGLEVGGW